MRSMHMPCGCTRLKVLAGSCPHGTAPPGPERYEVVAVNGGPWPLLSKDRLRVIVEVMVLERVPPGGTRAQAVHPIEAAPLVGTGQLCLHPCLVEVTIASGHPTGRIVPSDPAASAVVAAHWELEPAELLQDWLGQQDLSGWAVVQRARAGEGRPLPDPT